jgi:hypothetical protein
MTANQSSAVSADLQLVMIYCTVVMTITVWLLLGVFLDGTSVGFPVWLLIVSLIFKWNTSDTLTQTAIG